MSIEPLDNQGSCRPFCNAPKDACNTAAIKTNHKAKLRPYSVPSILNMNSLNYPGQSEHPQILLDQMAEGLQFFHQHLWRELAS